MGARVNPRAARQLAIRSRKADGSWYYRVLVINLPDALLFGLAAEPLLREPSLAQVGLATADAYDQRGGGVETSLRGSRQGLGMTKRSFPAQEMLVLLAELAYNLLTWTRIQLAARSPRLGKFGPLRMVRDLFHIAGRLRFDSQGRLLEIALAHTHELAAPFFRLYRHPWPRWPGAQFGLI